uniref:CHK kinase-like domain-containing protein n=1 Tax=Timema genevievae TaxID=629358 RepID=A0A7R9PQC1_TIMGE|nr:unnamed protein product [Timema genevievae]
MTERGSKNGLRASTQGTPNSYSRMTAVEEEVPSWLNDGFLQEILREFLDDPVITVIQSSVKDAVAKGENFISKLYKVTVEFKDRREEYQKRYFITKILPFTEETRKIFSESSAFPSEIRMLSDTLPKMYSLLDKAAPGRYKEFGPKCVFFKDTSPFILMMEDLCEQGFKMAERRKGLNLEHCLMVMRALGRFHASSFVVQEEDPLLAEFYKDNSVTEDATVPLLEGLLSFSLKAMTSAVESWPDVGATYAAKLRARGETIMADLKKLMKPDGNPFNVLIHGDLWVNNMMFKYDEVTGGVQEIKFIDFQLTRYTSPALDLHYFIQTSPSEEVSVAHTDKLLKEYHKELSKSMELLGRGNKVISFQDLLDEYERKYLYCFFAIVIILPMVLSDPSDGFDLEMSLQKEDSTTKLDNDMAKNETLMKALKRILPILVTKGVI